MVPKYASFDLLTSFLLFPETYRKYLKFNVEQINALLNKYTIILTTVFFEFTFNVKTKKNHIHNHLQQISEK